MTTDFTPWSTAAPLFVTEAPPWVPAEHQARVRAYDLYERMYWNEQRTFRLSARGTNTMPIYIPNPRIIIDTVNRYVAKGVGYAAMVEPNPLEGEQVGTEAEATLATQWFGRLFRRERFYSNFAANKLAGLQRGDSVWHVFANPLKPEGRRLSVKTVDPRSYFPLYDDPTDPESLRVVFLADIVHLGDKDYVRRLMYRRVLNDDGTGVVERSLAFFKTEPEAWYDSEAIPEAVPDVQVLPLETLDPRIQAIPVYHVPNNPMQNAQFGSSELRGLERVVAAVNQSISDEELVLALEGLGVYATDAGPPVDEEGNETNWLFGPGRVLELNDPAARFMRVNGVSTVGPFQDHIKYLERKGEEATGVNDVAKGTVEVSVAESGVALALRLAPLFARADYSESFFTDTMTNMWFDIQTGFLPVYEGPEFPGVVIQPTYQDRLPMNRAQRFNELIQGHTAGIFTTAYVLLELQKLGYEFPDGAEAMAAQALAEAQARTDAQVPTEPETPTLEPEEQPA